MAEWFIEKQTCLAMKPTPSPSVPQRARQRIADNIRRIRTERGLSQEALAEIAHFHRSYVSQLERCVTNISVDGLERLAGALGVDIVTLLHCGPPDLAGSIGSHETNTADDS